MQIPATLKHSYVSERLGGTGSWAACVAPSGEGSTGRQQRGVRVCTLYPSLFCGSAGLHTVPFSFLWECGSAHCTLLFCGCADCTLFCGMFVDCTLFRGARRLPSFVGLRTVPFICMRADRPFFKYFFCGSADCTLFRWCADCTPFLWVCRLYPFLHVCGPYPLMWVCRLYPCFGVCGLCPLFA